MLFDISLACEQAHLFGQGIAVNDDKREPAKQARRSEPAREQLIFDFRSSQGAKWAFHMSQITMQ